MLAKHGARSLITFLHRRRFQAGASGGGRSHGHDRLLPMLLHAFFQPWFSLAGAAALWAIVRRRKLRCAPDLAALLGAGHAAGRDALLHQNDLVLHARPAGAGRPGRGGGGQTWHRRYAGWILIAAVAGFAIYQMREMYWATTTISAATVRSVSIAWMLTRAPRRSGRGRIGDRRAVPWQSRWRCICTC